MRLNAGFKSYSSNRALPGLLGNHWMFGCGIQLRSLPLLAFMSNLGLYKPEMRFGT
jgi:hypothetical protein